MDGEEGLQVAVNGMWLLGIKQRGRDSGRNTKSGEWRVEGLRMSSRSWSCGRVKSSKYRFRHRISSSSDRIYSAPPSSSSPCMVDDPIPDAAIRDFCSWNTAGVDGSAWLVDLQGKRLTLYKKSFGKQHVPSRQTGPA